MVRLGGGRLTRDRVPQARDKLKIMAAIEKATRVLSLRRALLVLGLNRERYWAWHRSDEARCELDDRVSCPKSHPNWLTGAEKSTMRALVTSLDFRHVSVRALALHAQRLGRAYAAVGTWSRYIKAQGWRRPRLRLHPAKPKVGVTTTELWHIDVSIIKLLDGTKLHLHGVIDNFSRRLLAWELATKLDPTMTCRVLLEAGKHLEAGIPTVACDKGSENVNGEVDALIDAKKLKGVLAQVEGELLKSAMEAWWRSLTYGDLFMHRLNSVTAVEKLVAFYVE